MSKRGPRKTVVGAEKVGDYGNTRWVIKLDCGHVVEKPRKLVVGIDKVSCLTCTEKSKPAEVQVFDSMPDTDDPMADIKLQGSIAAHFGVRLDQVEVGFGMAKIYLDSDDIRNVMSR